MNRWLFFLLVLVVGCGTSGQPKLDATNEQTFEDSSLAMEKGLSDKEEQEDFIFCLFKLRSDYFQDEKGKTRSRVTEQVKKMHGMTAHEIIAAMKQPERK